MRERWARAAVEELDAALDWIETNHGIDRAARVAGEIAAAVERVARNPSSYAWVGSVYPALAGFGRDFRRVVVQQTRHVVFVRITGSREEVGVLAVRGPGQLPPTDSALASRGADPSGPEERPPA